MVAKHSVARSSTSGRFSTENKALHCNYAPKKHTLRNLLLICWAIFMFCSSALITAYIHINNKVEVLKTDNLLAVSGKHDNKKPHFPNDINYGKPINILLIGSDSRANYTESNDSGAVLGARSDTTMLIHIGASRKHIDVVSIPRDTLVYRPVCKISNGETYDAENPAMFNSAFSVGGSNNDLAAGAACTILTTEHLTNLHIDGFVIIDFRGVVSVVDSLGGVPMEIPEDINDHASGIHISKGTHILNGKEALAWVRTRESIGDGSDIGRIDRQQQFVSALLRKVLSAGVMTNPANLYSFLSAALQSIKTSPNLGSLNTIAGLASSLRNIDLRDVNFLTMPWNPAGNRVLAAPAARRVWEALQQDHPIMGSINGTQAPPQAIGSSVVTARDALNKLLKSGPEVPTHIPSQSSQTDTSH